MKPRIAARRTGALTYNTGKPCKHGHTTDRYTSTGGCLGCLHIITESTRRAVIVGRSHASPTDAAMLYDKPFPLSMHALLDKLHAAHHSAALIEVLTSILENAK